MCTSCLTLPTKSSYLFVDRSTSFKNSFPCGYCSDCIRKKKSEWQLRAYFEAKDCFRKSSNNFVLFDTLTYCDDKLVYFHDIYPRALYNYWDFMAFSRRDVNLFFKRLRTNLLRGCELDSDDCKPFGYHGRNFSLHLPPQPDSVGNVRYLLTSEYGTSEEYNGKRCTHRPHYHILFFVSFDIDPLLFSKYVSASWLHGRTDGFPYKSGLYINTERVIRSSSGNCLKLIRYVSKYIAKDMYVYRKLFNRVYNSFTISNPDWQKSYSGRLAFRRFKNQVLPFHLQSQGFGLYALQSEDMSYMDKFQAIRMPVSSKSIIASIPLSTYFKRKLYFSVQKFNGKLRWIPSDYYLFLKFRNFSRSVQDLRNRLFLWDSSLGIDKATSIAKYHLLWRGQLVPNRCLSMSDDSFLAFRYRNRRFPLMVTSDGDIVSDGCKCFYNFSSGPSSFNYGSYISDGYSPPKSGRVHRVWSLSEFEKQTPCNMTVVSQKIKRWSGYDDILDNYQLSLKEEGFVKDILQLASDRQDYRYKVLGLL